MWLMAVSFPLLSLYRCIIKGKKSKAKLKERGREAVNQDHSSVGSNQWVLGLDGNQPITFTAQQWESLAGSVYTTEASRISWLSPICPSLRKLKINNMIDFNTIHK